MPGEYLGLSRKFIRKLHFKLFIMRCDIARTVGGTFKTQMIGGYVFQEKISLR